MEKIDKSYFSADILDFISLLQHNHVKYLIVGGQATIFYGYARLKGAIDIFYENDEANVEKLFNALNDFWAGNIPAIKSRDELLIPGIVFQFGIPPNRIDLINAIGNVSFEQAWPTKMTVFIEQGTNNINLYPKLTDNDI